MFQAGEKVQVKTVEEMEGNLFSVNEDFFQRFGGMTATIISLVSPSIFEIEVDGVKKAVKDSTLKKTTATETPQRLQRMM